MLGEKLVNDEGSPDWTTCLSAYLYLVGQVQRNPAIIAFLLDLSLTTGCGPAFRNMIYVDFDMY